MTDLIKAADALAECQDAKDLLAACKVDLEKAVVGRTAQSQLMTIHRVLGYVEENLSVIHHTLTTYRQARESADGVKVKPLVWSEDEEHAMGYRENSLTLIGPYWVEDHENSGEWRTYFDSFAGDVFISGSDSEEDAKAAAQADYEARIKAALED
ncbi:hypothetical protein [Phaeobacter gallaeciensis]|uniref:Uncharacterized protein n=1 Tax=Phaeobacter gallaeciensis TaxID=60890 RepID=A0AAC9Z9R5_9RHOB|nr:hypothetical protein [Phaeobacter gallaeciensis]AHD10044.1 hypothetical protein Gal_02297 [Phaeobacter gallaeciensis DSM 26640]ATE93308.1 hypothetical protein PhaeoP11_02288 [Phaeobacter gallaeciensis]ATE96871.1 hypothetical protein PhaeoP73_01559 [Phaeobacter gallaeciensis]ATF01972.1 hypothetical protein PhaeoP75_02337 [Phaeobacter gallaeciensis]ATF06352.1 hypothetical protein PhaeoP63_02286 [Phaeobacter gallaeciensis]